MKTQRKWKIGQQAPFIVIMARLSLAERGMRCHNQDDGRKAVFIARLGTDPRAAGSLLGQGFSPDEAARLMWHRAHREQQAGSELAEECIPLCFPCVTDVVVDLFSQEADKAVVVLLSAIANGQDILLFDRNLEHSATHPAMKVIERDMTLAEFRREWAKQERDLLD